MTEPIAIESDAFAFSVRDADGRPEATLTDRHTGETWGPAPLALIQIINRPVQRIEPAGGVEQRVERSGDGAVRVVLEHKRGWVRAAVTFTLTDDAIVARIDRDDLHEEIPDFWQIAGVDVLPGLMRVDPDVPGHFVLPIRNGALCRPENHGRISDGLLTYGQQHRWEDLPMLPATGVVRERSESALLAVAESGECDAMCMVELDGRGGGWTGYSMRYCYTPIDPVDPVDRAVRIVPLRGTDASFQGMGRWLHGWVGQKRRERGLEPLASRASSEPDVRYAATSYTAKINHAIKDGGHIAGDGPMHVNCTFEQLGRSLRRARDAGVERIWVQSVGWNPEGHDGMWPTRFPVEPAVGGEQGFRDAIELGRSLGYMMSVHDNYIDSYKRSPEWDADLCVGDIYGQPLRQGIWSGGLNWRRWGLALPESQLDSQLQRVHDQGIRGMYYLDGMPMPLEISYNQKHGEQRYRRACAEGQVRMLDAARHQFGSVGSECGFLYGALACDYMASTFYREWPAHELCDVEVPLWCMAMRGHLFYDSDHLNRAVFDLPGRGALTHAKRLVEMGEVGLKPRGHFAGVYARYNFDTPIEDCLAEMRLEQRLFLDNADYCLAPIEDYQLLDTGKMPEQADRVTETRFADGTVIRCDFGKQEMAINGEPVDMPVESKRPLRPVGSPPAYDDAVEAGV